MTWTATEITLSNGSFAINIHDQDEEFICQLLNAEYEGTTPDAATIEQMRARARLIVQAEAMLKELDDLALAMEMGIIKTTTKARAIIKATGGNDE